MEAGGPIRVQPCPREKDLLSKKRPHSFVYLLNLCEARGSKSVDIMKIKVILCIALEHSDTVEFVG